MAVALISAFVLTTRASTPTFAQGPDVVPPDFDLTQNLVVNASDLSDAIDKWTTVQRTDACISDGGRRADFNGDGCLDVADLQRLAAATGNVTTPNAPILRAAPNATLEKKTFVVNTERAGKPTSNGIKDTNPGDGVCKTSENDCTLQAAVQEANARPGEDLITFNISVAGDACPALVVIRPNSRETEDWLQLDDSTGGTTIDGYTQCGAQKNSADRGSNAVIKIEIDGSVGSSPSSFETNGIEVKTKNNTILGLSLYYWDRQIELSGPGATFNHIEGNIVGTKADQSIKLTKGETHHREGIRIHIGAAYNIVGCGTYSSPETYVRCGKSDSNAARNIIAGNGNDGIHLESDGTVANRIIGNLIGLKGDGVTALANRADAVDFEKGPQYNWLGGENETERNVISGNGSEGIEISHFPTTQFNKVVGNYFGLSADGTIAVPNAGNGVSFEDHVNNNEAYGNIIAAQAMAGFRFYDYAYENTVRNNWVGVAGNKSSPMPNSGDGVYVMGGSHNNRIVANVIANNNEAGIDLTNDFNGVETRETFFNTISKNSIYKNNGRGIELSTTNGTTANQGRKAPTLLAANTALVTGKACANCVIEIFIADTTSTSTGGEGKTFVGGGSVDATGTFAVPIADTKKGDTITATATDALGNTSEFANNIKVTSADVAATATVVAATAQVQATATAAVQQTATAQAANATATAVAATAEAQAAATATAVEATAVAQTATVAAIQTEPALGGTATAIAVEETAVVITQTAVAAPGPCENTYCVILPLVQR